MIDLIRINRLDDNKLKSLVAAGEGICISLVMPAETEVDKRDENRIRLKNLMQSVEDELAALDYRRPDIERLLEPVDTLVSGGRFPTIKGQGLAIYLAEDASRAYQLPYAPEQKALVSSEFLIKPLMPLRLDEHFYILALSQETVRLLRATPFSFERMDLGDMPQSLGEALRWDDPEKQLQWHTQTGAESDGRAAVFHGHGVATKETDKENLLRYFHLLDEGLDSLLAGEDAPLVLAGVDYLLPIFREASAYDHIIGEEITGSHEPLSDAQLHEQAVPLVQSLLEEARAAVVERYGLNASRDLATTDVTDALLAAHRGRITTLFVATDDEVWGRFDTTSGLVDLHSDRQPGDSDLLNLATIYTVQNDGEVYAVPREAVPEGAPIAAIFRF